MKGLAKSARDWQCPQRQLCCYAKEKNGVFKYVRHRFTLIDTDSYMDIKTLKYEELSENIIASAYKVHNELGNGFLEKVYKNALAVELDESGIKYILEAPLKVMYRGKIVGDYIADLIVDGKIIVEVNAVNKVVPVHEVQLVNYLKATGITVGLLINFSDSVEIKRRVFG